MGKTARIRHVIGGFKNVFERPIIRAQVSDILPGAKRKAQQSVNKYKVDFGTASEEFPILVC